MGMSNDERVKTIAIMSAIIYASLSENIGIGAQDQARCLSA